MDQDSELVQAPTRLCAATGVIRSPSQCLGGVTGELLLPKPFILARRVQTWKVSRVLNQRHIRYAYMSYSWSVSYTTFEYHNLHTDPVCDFDNSGQWNIGKKVPPAAGYLK